MWEFNIGWFLAGIAAIVVGTLIIVFHKWIGDNFASGMVSYGKIKLFGLAAIGIGLLFMTNLHTTLLRLIFHIIMPSKF